jgi:hypothetical protein
VLLVEVIDLVQCQVIPHDQSGIAPNSGIADFLDEDSDSHSASIKLSLQALAVASAFLHLAFKPVGLTFDQSTVWHWLGSGLGKETKSEPDNCSETLERGYDHVDLGTFLIVDVSSNRLSHRIPASAQAMTTRSNSQLTLHVLQATTEANIDAAFPVASLIAPAGDGGHRRVPYGEAAAYRRALVRHPLPAAFKYRELTDRAGEDR